MQEIEIIKAPSKEKPFLIINKPHNLPTAPLDSQDTNNALYIASKHFPEILNVAGKKTIEHGLIHRIDTVTEGLVLISTTQECYNDLIQLQKENKIIKTYKAECEILRDNPVILEGFAPETNEMRKFFQNLEAGKSIKIESFFRPFGTGKKEVRPVTKESGEAALKKLGKPVLYSTEIKITEYNPKENKCYVECKITNGFRHQVRCHLAWLGLPIKGDKLYNSAIKNNAENSTMNIEFSAYSLNINGDLYTQKET